MTQILGAGGVKLTAVEIARFWSRVNVGPRKQCWTWKTKMGKRYAYFRVYRDGQCLFIGAHVVALTLKLGHDHFEVAAHSCDNMRCVNPEHLSAGTYSSNLVESWDRRRRGQLVSRMPGQITIEHAGGGSAEPARADEIPF